MYVISLWGAKVEFNAYFLNIKIHFLILELHLERHKIHVGAPRSMDQLFIFFLFFWLHQRRLDFHTQWQQIRPSHALQVSTSLYAIRTL